MLHTHTLGMPLTNVLSHVFAITMMPTSGKLMSVAEIEISRRYPLEEGLWNILPNDMVAIPIAGKAVIHTKDWSRELSFADVVEIPAGTQYYWECMTPIVRILAINSPPFDDADRKA